MPTLGDLFGRGVTGNFLAQGLSEEKVGQLRNRHRKEALALIDEDGFYRRNGSRPWKVPYGLRYALRRPYLHVQVVNRYPWKAVWTGKDGRQRTKKFMSPVAAIDFAALAHTKGVRVYIVSRQRGYDIPPRLRGKIPKPYKWCPYCLSARKYRHVGEDVTFYAMIKEWSDEKQQWVWRERKVYLTQCEVCHCSNRDVHFRRSNQPWHVRKFKKGARRAKVTLPSKPSHSGRKRRNRAIKR
jgi:hypothetical protein